jgi:PKD repeat protein
MALPVSNFYATPTSGYTPLAVVFTDTSTSADPFLSWFWTFGDGYTSNVQNPLHTYTHPGTYTVTLAVTTIGGTDTKTKVLYIAVAQAPVVMKTQDIAQPTSLPLLREMPATGDGKQSTMLRGVRYYKTNDADDNGSGFKRPNGPLLTFD